MWIGPLNLECEFMKSKYEQNLERDHRQWPSVVWVVIAWFIFFAVVFMAVITWLIVRVV